MRIPSVYFRHYKINKTLTVVHLYILGNFLKLERDVDLGRSPLVLLASSFRDTEYQDSKYSTIPQVRM